MSRWLSVCRDAAGEDARRRCPRPLPRPPHLVLQAAVVRDEERGAQRRVAQTPQEAAALRRRPREVQDLLQGEERSRDPPTGSGANRKCGREPTVRKLEKAGVSWRTCSRVPEQLRPSPT